MNLIDKIKAKRAELNHPLFEATIKPVSDEQLEAVKKFDDQIKKVANVAEKAPTPTIKDSGARTQFASGAVRDIQKGKGRCDLVPLDVMARMLDNKPIEYIYLFQKEGTTNHLYMALYTCDFFENYETMMLEVSKHFEDGAEKYGEYNWQLGMDVKCFINSAVRHYLKHLRGDRDEPHDRAFCWNIMCAIWTCRHKPELNNYLDLEAILNENT
jgi:hypothetical protein